MAIWGRYRGEVEKIDDEDRYLADYRMAFNSEWTLWVGRKKDEPTKEE